MARKSPTRLTRRWCLKTAATAWLGSRLPSGSTFASAPASRPSKTMTLGFSTYGSGSMPWPQALGYIADTGYDSVELAVLHDRDTAPENLDRNARQRLRDMLSRRALELTSFLDDLKETGDEEEHRANMERLKRAVELAHVLGSDAPPLIQTIVGPGKWFEVRSKLRDRLGDWVELARSSQTVIAIKPHRGHALSRPDEAIWLFGQLGHSPWLRMVFDYSHFDGRGMPLEQALKHSLPWTAHVAAKDVEFQKDGKYRFVLPGQTGRIDYPKMLHILDTSGYRGDVCVEISSMVWRQKDYDALATMKKCYAMLSRAFESARVRRTQRRSEQ